MIRRPDRSRIFRRTLVEMAFIIFLFYSNLLMGQYSLGHDFGEKPILVAIKNIVTLENFIIAVTAAFIGHIAFDSLRKRL